jgi:hypothetical protein
MLRTFRIVRGWEERFRNDNSNRYLFRWTTYRPLIHVCRRVWEIATCPSVHICSIARRHELGSGCRFGFFGSDMDVFILLHTPTWITNHFDDTYSDIPSRTMMDSRSAGRNTTVEWCTLLTMQWPLLSIMLRLAIHYAPRGVSSLLPNTHSYFPIQTSFTHQEIVRRIILTWNSGLFGPQVRSLTFWWVDVSILLTCYRSVDVGSGLVGAPAVCIPHLSYF